MTENQNVESIGLAVRTSLFVIRANVFGYWDENNWKRKAKFPRNEISPLWMRNLAKMTAKFPLTQLKFAGALTKFCGDLSSKFRESNGRNSANFAFIMFAQYCSWTTSPPLSIAHQKNCPRLMPQGCAKRPLSCASRQFGKPGGLSVGPT